MTERKKKIYFIGIGGIGMSAAAGLLKQAGHNVVGSDLAVGPPVSFLLEDLKIPVKQGYTKENIKDDDSDIFVFGNSLSRDNPEIEYVVASKRAYSSFPQVISELCLGDKTPVVVCGTHGKSTTSSWLVSCLKTLALDPSYLIGGIPIGAKRSSSYTKEKLFVLEGDEYDTAFFDKGSKFLHYKPQYLVLNNIEYDHADIFKNIEAIYNTFEKLFKLLPSHKNIVANIDDQGVTTLLNRLGMMDQVYKVSCSGKHKQESDLALLSYKMTDSSSSLILFHEKEHGEFEVGVSLVGEHNVFNALQCVAMLFLLKKNGFMQNAAVGDLVSSLSSFKGVQKRLEKVGRYQQALIYKDFAHHPTAVDHALKTIRKMYPKARIVVGFEPKNATSRRNTFIDRYAKAFEQADLVFFLPPEEDLRIKESERMDIHELQRKISKGTAHVLESKEKVIAWCSHELRENDVCLFLSCADFLGVPHELVAK